MAQEFRRYTANNIGTSAVAIPTAAAFNSYDTIIGISLANITASPINASVYINDGTDDIYLIKDAPIPTGGALQVIDGGAKFVVQSGDRLYVQSDTAASIDCFVSVVDNISA
jgi:hypothetical protein